MLPDDVVQQIRAKETRREQAKVERAEKKEHATELSDAIRLEQLRHIPKSQRSVEEQREFTRLYGRSRRRDEKGEESPFAKVENAEEFWAANRLTLPKKKLDEYLAQQELVEDQEHWMQHGFEADPNDENEFVGLAEGLQDLDAFISTHGLIHDEPSACQHPDLRGFQPSWGLFALKDTHAFYKDPERFNALCQESPATEICARYGTRTALGAYAVREFKRRITEHERGKLQPDVRRAHLEFESDKCWLCNFERLHGAAARQQPQEVPQQ